MAYGGEALNAELSGGASDLRLAEEQREFDESPEGVAGLRQWWIAQTLASPISRVIAGLAGDLSAADWAALHAGR